MIRAKMKVIEVNRNIDGGEVKLSPVTSGSKENDEFYKYTPGGRLVLMIINKSTTDLFNPGDEFFVDLTKCE